MGKWSPNYTEDLLRTKISTLVAGALRRAAVDNDATLGNMTYENFVHDLDPGDSFATTMVDILVRELAERRARPHADRRYLSSRTVKSLRQLATPLNQYPSRARGHVNHRRAYMPPSDPFEEVDDENFTRMLAEEEANENLHRSTADLYDAISIPWPRRSEEPGSSSAFRTGTRPQGVRSPPANARVIPPWSILPTPSPLPATTLTRQASVRRPFNNSRHIEFSNYTRRHRPSHREGFEGEGIEGAAEPRDEASTSRSMSTARRFFPAMATRRMRRGAHQSPPTNQDTSDETSSGDEDPLLLAHSVDQFTAYGAHYSPSVGLSFAAAMDADPPGFPAEDEEHIRVVAAPRLRRGGLRAPEYLVARNATPPADRSLSPAPHPSTSSTPQNVGIAVEEILGEPAAYPTPGSTEGEHLT